MLRVRGSVRACSLVPRALLGAGLVCVAAGRQFGFKVYLVLAVPSRRGERCGGAEGEEAAEAAEEEEEGER